MRIRETGKKEEKGILIASQVWSREIDKQNRARPNTCNKGEGQRIQCGSTTSTSTSRRPRRPEAGHG